MADEVILDLVRRETSRSSYFGRRLRWFSETKALNDWQKDALREQWGTLQKILVRARMERVVQDIVFDFGVKPR